MENLTAEDRLVKKGVKCTANRIIVLRTLMRMDHPVSLSELEDLLETLDKSSIFRVLTLFLEHDLVHAIEDGSGSLKYEVCGGEEECTLSDMHVHFHCEKCHRTFCFENLPIPTVDLPEGFSIRSINYMVKGICPKCSLQPDCRE